VARAPASLASLAIAAGRRIEPLRVRGIPRLLYKTAPFVIGRGVQTVESVSGLRLAVDTAEYASCMMVYGRYAPEIVALLKRLVRSGDSVLDIGAQLGYMTAHLARLVGPEGSVHSFEPDPAAISRLRRTIEENGFDWVRVFPVAASDRPGKLTLHISPTLGWSTAVAGSHLTGLVPIEVDSVPVDDLAERGEIRRPVRLAKVDVEGFEAAVLDGMREVIAADRPYLILEVNPPLMAPLGQTPLDLLARVAEHGYRIHRIREPRGLLAGGRFELTRVSPEDVINSCDVLCVPEEAAATEPALRGSVSDC
jgi:FkbM family methyltransferase